MTGTQSANHAMSDATQYPVLASVEREMLRARIWPNFTPQIERLYRNEAAAYSKKPVVMLWLMGLCLFDMFLVTDYILAPGDLLLYVTGRLAVATPACLALLYAAVHVRSCYDALISTMPVLLSATLTFLFMTSHGSYRADYMFGDILILMCGCVINRSLFGYALVSVALQCVLFQVVLFGSDIVTSGGTLLHMLFCVSGAVVALVTSYTLEKERRQSFLLDLRVRLLNRQLEMMAMTDPLTGLANRRRLAEATERFWARQAAQPPQAGIILIDIDHFKLFNDRLGHMAGDACLAAIAGHVCLALRSRDLAVRFGGEKILVFLPDTDLAAASAVAEAVCRSIRAAHIPHPGLGEKTVVTASLGVHAANTRDCTLADIITRADAALYAAKAAGRDCVRPLPPSNVQPQELASSAATEGGGLRAPALA